MSALTAYRKELRERILQVAMGLFTTHGIRAVKMDDIAQQLAISKRTLYEIYQDKESLLLEGMKRLEAEKDEQMLRFVADSSHNTIDILVAYYQLQVESTKNLNPLFVSDLHRYRQVFKYLKRLNTERELKALEFFNRGIEEGFFRSDVNYKLASSIGSKAMQAIMTQQMYKGYKMLDVFKSYVFVFIRGFCTQKGVELLDRELTRCAERRDLDS